MSIPRLLALVGTGLALVAYQNCGTSFSVDPARSGAETFGSATGDPITQGQLLLGFAVPQSGDAAKFAVTLNATESWNAGLRGRNVRIYLPDQGTESAHEDLAGQTLVGECRDYSKNPPYLVSTSEPLVNGTGGSGDNHGTAVAGLMVALEKNHLGSHGIAPGAKIATTNLLSVDSRIQQNASLDPMIDSISGDFDIVNMSWGSSSPLMSDDLLTEVFRLSTKDGRGGKGIIYVQAAGNDFLGQDSTLQLATPLKRFGNSNFDDFGHTPYLITVGAYDIKGEHTSYSSMGANLWVAAPSGDSSTTDPKTTVVTTDRSGCLLGYSNGSAPDFNFDFDIGKLLTNSKCNYTHFAGTSAAAPIAAGAIALLLEANPALSWRDVKYLLAKTAMKIDPNRGPIKSDKVNEVFPASFILGFDVERGWITNAAGFNFSNYYGFGAINLDAAVRLSKGYVSSLGEFQEMRFHSSYWPAIFQTVNLAIPDANAAGVTSTVTVDAKLVVEQVQIDFGLDHANAADVAVEITSPSGTKSMLLHMGNTQEGKRLPSIAQFISNAFYGEQAIGTWTLKVVDGRTSNSGTLKSWGIEIFGKPVDPAQTGGLTLTSPQDGATVGANINYGGTCDAAGGQVRILVSGGTANGILAPASVACTGGTFSSTFNAGLLNGGSLAFEAIQPNSGGKVSRAIVHVTGN